MILNPANAWIPLERANRIVVIDAGKVVGGEMLAQLKPQVDVGLLRLTRQEVTA